MSINKELVADLRKAEARITELTAKDSDISHYAAMVVAENRKLEARITELTAAAQAVIKHRHIPVGSQINIPLLAADIDALAEVINGN